MVEEDRPDPDVAPACPPGAAALTADEQELADDIAAGIDRRLRTLEVAAPLRGTISRGPRNVSFVIDCRSRMKERRWDVRRQRRVCAVLERRYVLAGWKYASIYVMEDDHLRLRVTLQAERPRPAARPA
jgi:hypothetical protein